MEMILIAKFQQNPNMAQILKETGNAKLIELTVSDAFWGVNRNTTVGKNMLGELLMNIRDHHLI